MDCSAHVNRPGAGVNGSADAFRAIAEMAGDIAFVIDCPAGILRYVSPSVDSLFGLSPATIGEHLAGRNPQPQLAGLCGGIGERLRRFAAGDATRLRVVREYEVKSASGQVIPIEVTSLLLLDEGGTPTALAGLVRDLSGLRALELEQKRFASMLNHEFRTPLSTIDGAIQRLEATSGHADEATRQRYRKIAVAVDQLIGMLDEYLSPDRLATIGRQRQPASIAPGQLLQEGAEQVRSAGRKAALSAGDLPDTLRCEPAGLRLALKVLVDNALAFSPSHATIELSGRCVPGGIELAVRDHGPGVAEEDKPRIFDKFYRGKNAHGLPGSGLGLYMARSVVEVHGGTLNLAEAEGQGADFRIWLPVSGAGGKSVASGRPNSDNRLDQAG